MFISIVLVSILYIINTNAIHYEPNWPSLDSRPLPTWYDEAKVGIFMHFGPYAVPGIIISGAQRGAENMIISDESNMIIVCIFCFLGLEDAWFWRNWHDNVTSVVKYMEENYPPNFTYQDFGRDLKMEFFNASWISELVKDSGAKYGF